MNGIRKHNFVSLSLLHLCRKLNNGLSKIVNSTINYVKGIKRELKKENQILKLNHSLYI